MKKVCFSVVLAAVSGVVPAAEWETAAEPRLYGVTFSDYAEGERLSDKGATGGTWNDASGEATAAKTIDGRTCMTCEAASLLFNTTPGLNGPKVSKASVYLPGCRELVNLRPNDKAAFAIGVPGEGEVGEPVFMGWSGQEWCKLYAPVVPVPNKWYDIAVWVVKNLDNVRLVQYRVKVDGSYVALRTGDGAEWLNSGIEEGDAVVREVEIRGSGAFDELSGRELPSPGVVVHCK